MIFHGCPWVIGGMNIRGTTVYRWQLSAVRCAANTVHSWAWQGESRPGRAIRGTGKGRPRGHPIVDLFHQLLAFHGTRHAYVIHGTELVKGLDHRREPIRVDL